MGQSLRAWRLAVSRPAPSVRLFVGIDLGTSGIRLGAIDDKGRPYTVLSRHWKPDQAFNPGAWLGHTTDLIALLQRKAPHARIEALAVDGTSGTVLLCHPHTGRPLTSVLPYDDGRATQEARDLAADGLTEGPAAGPYGGPAKILWLGRHGVDHARAQVVTQASWLTGALLGHWRYCDEHNALKLGFENQWHDALIGRHWPVKWPDIRPAGAPLGRLCHPLARRLRLHQAPLIVAGTTDSTAASLAQGPLSPGMGITSLGSSLVLKIVSPRPISVPECGVYSHRIGSLYLAGGASNSGGAVLAHYFSQAALAQLSAELPIAPPTGLDYYPLLTVGERFPHYDPLMEPRLHPRPTDDRVFLQGILEGLADIEAQGYAVLARHGAPRLILVTTTGGGARNNAWRLLRERALGVPVQNAAQRPAVLGSAYLARIGSQIAHQR